MLHDKTVICVIALVLSMVAAMVQGQGDLPVEISPVTIPGTIGECPSEDSRQASRNLLGNTIRDIIRSTPHPECGPGNWRRVFYLNATRSDQSCPGQ